MELRGSQPRWYASLLTRNLTPSTHSVLTPTLWGTIKPKLRLTGPGLVSGQRAEWVELADHPWLLEAKAHPVRASPCQEVISQVFTYANPSIFVSTLVGKTQHWGKQEVSLLSPLLLIHLLYHWASHQRVHFHHPGNLNRLCNDNHQSYSKQLRE